MASSRSQINIGLLGLGIVGGSVARFLLEKASAYEQTVGVPLRIAKVLERLPERADALGIDRSLLAKDPAEVLENPEIDIVVELLGGEDPAYGFQRRALESGKFVATANKEVLAKHGSELRSLAWSKGVDIGFEAAVGGGIPIIAPLKRDLLANDIVGISAIINGTTNYILTSMSQQGTDFGDALRKAQELGYAEADPTNDIEGFDATYKITILASLAFRGEVKPEDVYREGITKLTAHDFRYAAEMGYTIKLLAIAKRSPGGVDIRVHPALISNDQPLAKVDGVLNAVQVEGDLLGRALFEGRGAGGQATSSAVVADIIDAARRILNETHERGIPGEDGLLISPIGNVQTRYYLRMKVADEPMVLAQISSVLGHSGISIASVIQKELDQNDGTAEIVIMTHMAREAAMRQALETVAKLPVVVEIAGFLRVEE